MYIKPTIMNSHEINLIGGLCALSTSINEQRYVRTPGAFKDDDASYKENGL